MHSEIRKALDKFEEFAPGSYFGSRYWKMIYDFFNCLNFFYATNEQKAYQKEVSLNLIAKAIERNGGTKRRSAAKFFEVFFETMGTVFTTLPKQKTED